MATYAGRMHRIRALALSTHPGPGLAVTAITVLLGVASGLEPWRIAVLGVAVALNQASVGLSNDWIDADRDRAVKRTDKPVARGDISPAAARNAAFATAAAAVLLTIPLGWSATVIHAAFIMSAWMYNARLKNSALSVLPYIVSFGILPAIVTLARAEPAFAAWWVVAAGALLGAGAHFANVLPDLDDDAATGIRGLPHRLGRRGSVVVTWVALLAASVSLAFGLGFDAIGIAGLGVSLVIAAVGLVLGLRGAGRGLFRLVIAGAGVDVALLVLAGSRMLA